MASPRSRYDEQNYIRGEWVPLKQGGRIESTNPADPSEVVATFPNASRETATDAVDAAAAAQAAWAARSVRERRGYLRAAAEEIRAHKESIAALLTAEMGKPISAARGEVQRAVDLFEYYGELAQHTGGETVPSNTEDTLAYTTREPMGVAGLITPWNFPIAIPA
jgi:aldehyde dehydrogenase (NAD+)